MRMGKEEELQKEECKSTRREGKEVPTWAEVRRKREEDEKVELKRLRRREKNKKRRKSFHHSCRKRSCRFKAITKHKEEE